MKRICLSLTLSLVCCLFSFAQSGLIQKHQKVPKKDRIDLAMSQEILMTQDPKLGSIPRKRILKAKTQMDMQVVYREVGNMSWQERGPNNVGGRTRALLFDANDASGKKVYAAGVSGGLWTTSNITATNPQWQCVDDFFGSLAICAIAQDPSNPDNIYFATGEGFFEENSNPGLGVWKSVNGGITWAHMTSTSNSNFEFTQSLEIDKNGNIYAATKSGLFKSTNGGSNWTKILGAGNGALSNHLNDIEINSNGDIYATVGIYNEDGIYKSTNGGTSWTKLSNGLPSSGYGRIELAIAPSNNDIIYAVFEDASDHAAKGVYRSGDGGAQWQVKDNPDAYGMDNFARTQAWYNLAIAVDPEDPNHIILGGIDLLSSTNGGDSWVQLSQWNGNSSLQKVHADQHCIKFNPNDNKQLIVGNDGGVYYSNNADDIIPTFSMRNDGYNITQFYAAAMHPAPGTNYFLAGAQDNGTQIFNQTGIESTEEASGGDGARCFIDEDNPSIQITSYVFNNYFVSTDNGENFTYVQLNNYGLFANASDYDSDANILYASSSAGNVLRWKNPHTLSTSFQHIIISSMAGQEVSQVVKSPSIPNRIYLGTTTGNVFYIDDAHTGFFKSGTQIRNAAAGFVSGITIDPNDEDHIAISYSNYGISSVFETNDGGNNWSDIEGNLPDMPIRGIMMNPLNTEEFLLATELGVWTTANTTNDNTLWTPQNNGLANVRTDQLVYRPSDQLLLAATHGRGLYSSSSLNSSVVPVEIESFSASLSSNAAVKLEWIVSQEIGLERYTVERSFDGENWDELVIVAANNDNERRVLDYTDKDLYVRNEHYYYRILSEDIDGTIGYSEVRSLYVSERTKKFSINFGSNPFVEDAIVDSKTDFARLKGIKVCDVMGGILFIRSSEELASNLSLGLRDFPSGTYFVSYETIDGVRGVRKMIKSGGEEDDDDDE